MRFYRWWTSRRSTFSFCALALSASRLDACKFSLSASCACFIFPFHCNDSDLTAGNPFFSSLQSFADMSNNPNLEVVEAVEEGVAEETTRAAWEGSYVGIADINWLIRTRRIPAEVECRLPGPETSPDLKEGEYVVFVEHFERGFGLPASPFFRSFLNKFGLQPHQLPANAFTTLSAFASDRKSVV